MIAAGEFIEWADVFGHLYGTSKGQVEKALAAGRDVLLDIDVQGHQQVRKRLPEALSVFVIAAVLRGIATAADAPALGFALELSNDGWRQPARKSPIGPNTIIWSLTTVFPRPPRLCRRSSSAGRFRRQNQAERAQEICKTFGG